MKQSAASTKFWFQNTEYVAFTPKGGCPLKRAFARLFWSHPRMARSIHPQGWVPVETGRRSAITGAGFFVIVAFTPKGGCPLKRRDAPREVRGAFPRV